MTGDSAPTSPTSCAARVPRTGAEVFTMTDPGVHDADRGVHGADRGVHDADPGVHDADPGVHDADLAVHDGPIRAFTMDRFSHKDRKDLKVTLDYSINLLGWTAESRGRSPPPRS